MRAARQHQRAGGGRSEVRAGDVFSAEAKRGRRFVKIIQVRGLSPTSTTTPYALAREILPSGEPARGWLRGVDRSLEFAISLRWSPETHSYEMPPWYRREEETTK